MARPDDITLGDADLIPLVKKRASNVTLQLGTITSQ